MVSLNGLNNNEISSDCQWTDAADSPEATFESRGVVYQEELYVFGGWKPGIQITDQTSKYNLATDSWATLAPMPIVLTHAATVKVGNKLWLLGGFLDRNFGPPTSAVQIYDFDTNTWSSGPALPINVASGAAALLNNKIHFFGGLQEDRPSARVLPGRSQGRFRGLCASFR